MTTTVPTRASISTARRALLDLMRSIGFGRIEDLIVIQGDPVYRPAPRVIREIKFGRETAPEPEHECDFALKAQVIDFFNQLDQIRDGRIERLEIKHGLPFRMNVVHTDTGGEAAA